MADLKRPLSVGRFVTTETFREIRAHECVCFDDTHQTLVAVTGRDGDREAVQYAQLFAAAPDLLAACEEALQTLRVAVQCGLVGFSEEKTAEIVENHGTIMTVKAAIAKATGMNQTEAQGLATTPVGREP